MPLYEYFCSGCLKTFEALVALSASQRGDHTCPDCGERSRRILSAANFALQRRSPVVPQSHIRDGHPEVTSLRLPPAARLCWMDDQSAARLAAYGAGRGAEYDDTVAARREIGEQLGEPDKSEPAPPAHSHSPLSDPVVLANRRKAAQQEKVAESTALRESERTKQA